MVRDAEGYGSQPKSVARMLWPVFRTHALRNNPKQSNNSQNALGEDTKKHYSLLPLPPRKSHFTRFCVGTTLVSKPVYYMYIHIIQIYIYVLRWCTSILRTLHFSYPSSGGKHDFCCEGHNAAHVRTGEGSSHAFGDRRSIII